MVFARPTVNVTNITEWSAQRSTILQNVSQKIAPSGALAPGQLAEQSMIQLSENGTGFEIRFPFYYTSQTPFYASRVHYRIKSSDPVNKMNFTGIFPGLSVSRFGKDLNGSIKNVDDPLITELYGAGVANAFYVSSNDAVGKESIRQFIESNRPWTITAEYWAEGQEVIETSVAFNLPAPPPPITNPAIAAFTASIAVGQPTSVIQFTDKSRNATSWLWDFGDNTSSSLQNPTHQYTVTGEKTVTLTVSGNGTTNKESAIIYVAIPLPPTKPFSITVRADVVNGNVVEGTPLEISGQIDNVGTGNYVGVIASTWELSINNGAFTNWVSAGSVTNLVSGETKKVLTYKWNAGRASPTQYRFRLRSVASDGDHFSSESVQIVTPLQPVILKIVRSNSTQSTVSLSGPAGTYRILRSDNLLGWSTLTVQVKGEADVVLVTLNMVLEKSFIKAERVN